MQQFKCRASKLGDLYTNARTGSGLSQTALEMAKRWVKDVLYGRPLDKYSKYTDKGHRCEQEGIDLYNSVNGTSLLKNTERITNDWITGECDLLIPNVKVIDIKNSYSDDTFPLFDNEIPTKAYELQVQGYMWLYDAPCAEVVYTLCDAPDDHVDREAQIQARIRGEDEVTEELFNEVKERMTYSHLPLKLRYKSFKFTRDESFPEKTIERIIKIREHIKNTLWADQQ